MQLTTIKRKIKSIALASSSLFLLVIRKSSLIDVDVDNNVFIKKFFKWILKKISLDCHVKLRRIYNIIKNQEWTINNLKSITNFFSTSYRVAIE